MWLRTGRRGSTSNHGAVKVRWCAGSILFCKLFISKARAVYEGILLPLALHACQRYQKRFRKYLRLPARSTGAFSTGVCTRALVFAIDMRHRVSPHMMHACCDVCATSASPCVFSKTSDAL